MIYVDDRGLFNEKGDILVRADEVYEASIGDDTLQCVSFKENRKDFLLHVTCHPQLRYYSPVRRMIGTLIDQLSEQIGPFRVCRFLTLPEHHKEVVNVCKEIVEKSWYKRSFGNILIRPQLLASKFSHPRFQLVSVNSEEVYYVVSNAIFGALLPEDRNLGSVSVSSNHYLWAIAQLVCQQMITSDAERVNVLLFPWSGNVLVDEEPLWQKIGESE